ncbi:MAG: hypothetical protein ACRC5R_02200 [Mycoplasmatales bacterium]
MTVQDLEIKFISIYKDGFKDEVFLEESKKFNDKKVYSMFEDEMSKDVLREKIMAGKFDDVLESYLWLIKRSWLPSRFDKRAFMNFIQRDEIKVDTCILIYEIMYGDLNANFDRLIDVLSTYKGDKECNYNASTWPIVSTFLFYSKKDYYPIKPTTVKKIGQVFNVDFEYTPRPNLNTYKRYNIFCKSLLKESTLCKTKQQIDILIFIAIHY